MNLGKILNIDSKNPAHWAQLLSEHQMIIVSYYSTVECALCVTLNTSFAEMSQDPKYKAIKFLTIDTANNPIADQYIRKRKQPFIAIFKKGILVECNSVQSENGITRMLDTLSIYNLNL